MEQKGLSCFSNEVTHWVAGRFGYTTTHASSNLPRALSPVLAGERKAEADPTQPNFQGIEQEKNSTPDNRFVESPNQLSTAPADVHSEEHGRPPYELGYPRRLYRPPRKGDYEL